MTDRISDQLLAQRLRNRIMEVLSIYCCDEDWASLGPDEVINQWEDFVDRQRFAIFIEPVFTTEEQTQLKRHADELLHLFEHRGKLSEDVEIPLS